MIFSVVTMTIADVIIISINAQRRTLSNNIIYLNNDARCCLAESGPVFLVCRRAFDR